MVFCVSLSPPIMSVPTFMSVPTYYVCPPFYVCPHLFRLSQPIMSVPTYYVCPHLLCLSPPIMSVPTFYVCPHLLCLSPPIMSVPTFYVCPHPLFFCWQALLKSRVWHFQPNLFSQFTQQTRHGTDISRYCCWAQISAVFRHIAVYMLYLWQDFPRKYCCCLIYDMIFISNIVVVPSMTGFPSLMQFYI